MSLVSHGIRVQEHGPRRKIIVRRASSTRIGVHIAGLLICASYPLIVYFVLGSIPVKVVAAGLFVAACFALLYYWVQRTVVTVDRGVISIRHGPLPPRVHFEVPEADVERFAHFRTLRPRSAEPWGQLQNARLHVAAKLRSGETLVLVPNLATEGRAQAVLKAIQGDLDHASRRETVALKPSSPMPDLDEIGPPPTPLIHLEEHGTRLIITKSWRNRRRWNFVALLDVALGFGLAGVVLPAVLRLSPPGGAWSFLGISVAMLVTVSWALLTSRSVLTVDARTLRVWNRRWVFPRRRTFRVDDLVQIYGLKVKGEVLVRTERRTFFRYHLAAILQDGDRVLVIPNLECPKECRYLEAVLEARIGIADQPVPGELKSGRIAIRSRLWTEWEG